MSICIDRVCFWRSWNGVGNRHQDGRAGRTANRFWMEFEQSYFLFFTINAD